MTGLPFPLSRAHSLHTRTNAFLHSELTVVATRIDQFVRDNNRARAKLGSRTRRRVSSVGIIWALGGRGPVFGLWQIDETLCFKVWGNLSRDPLTVNARSDCKGELDCGDGLCKVACVDDDYLTSVQIEAIDDGEHETVAFGSVLGSRAEHGFLDQAIVTCVVPFSGPLLALVVRQPVEALEDILITIAAIGNKHVDEGARVFDPHEPVVDLREFRGCVENHLGIRQLLGVVLARIDGPANELSRGSSIVLLLLLLLVRVGREEGEGVTVNERRIDDDASLLILEA